MDNQLIMMIYLSGRRAFLVFVYDFKCFFRESNCLVKFLFTVIQLEGDETKTNRRPGSIQSQRFQRKDNLKIKRQYVSISTFQLLPECGFPLQNSNIPFSKICCKIQISRPVSKCDVGCLRSVGEAVSAEWPSWKWARICIPSVPLCIFHENANLHFFSQNKRKHLLSYLARFCIISVLICILKKMQTCTQFSRFFCQDLRVHQMAYATLHILLNTYDGLLAMKLDS